MLPALTLHLGRFRVVLACHALAVLAGVLAAAWVVLRRARAPGVALVALAAGAVAALAGAHTLFHALHGGPHGLWSGGLASTGGVVAGFTVAAAVARLGRRPVLEVLDALAPAGLLALAIGRLGCFLAGCCYGRPTTLPWGVVFPELGPPARHPLQLYSAVGDFAVFLLLPPATAPRGTVTQRAAILFGLLRTALELLRDPVTTDALTPWLTLPQATALLLVAVAYARAAVCRSRLNTPPSSPCSTGTPSR